MTFVFFACRLRQGVSLLSSKLALVTGKRVKCYQSMRSQIVTSIHFKRTVTGNPKGPYIIKLTKKMRDKSHTVNRM